MKNKAKILDIKLKFKQTVIPEKAGIQEKSRQATGFPPSRE